MGDPSDHNTGRTGDGQDETCSAKSHAVNNTSSAAKGRLGDGGIWGFDGFRVGVDVEEAQDKVAAGLFDELIGEEAEEQEEAEAQRNEGARVLQYRLNQFHKYPLE
jgi:hypothetical protein